MGEVSRTRERLAKELLRIRDLAAISGREMGRRIGVPQPTMVRVDRGQSLLTMANVRQWLIECAADQDTTERVLALAEAAHGETRPWRDLLDDRDQLQDVAHDRNTAARLSRFFQPTVVPGLLQTPEVARRVLQLGRTNVEASVAARMERQAILLDTRRQFHFLIGQEVLRRAGGTPEASAEQLERIESVSGMSNVEVAVLPDAVLTTAWHNFVIREPADGSPTYVTVELVHGQQEVYDAESVGIYLDLWNRLWTVSARGEQAVRLMELGSAP